MPMQAQIAFLRAVNVGGTGKLAMSDLQRICVEAGFSQVKTYIASGNVCFTSRWSCDHSRAAIEDGLFKLTGNNIRCFVYSLEELNEIIDNNPFAAFPGNQTVAILLQEEPKPDVLIDLKAHNTEQLQIGPRCIYVYYPDGMGKSRLVIPAAQSGSARNFNTLQKMRELALHLAV